MPELPDVEAFRQVLASCARGRRIERVEVFDESVLRDVSARRLRRTLEGRRFRRPERHGKWLLARTDDAELSRTLESQGPDAAGLSRNSRATDPSAADEGQGLDAQGTRGDLRIVVVGQRP